MPSNGHNGLPAYQRIQTAIRGRISSGELKPGDSVASERELARLHSVSLMTARHALAGLEQEGVVERRRSPCEATITASRALRISYMDNSAAVPAN